MTAEVASYPGPSGANADAGPDRFRALMADFPTGVAVVTTVDGTGRPHGFTCTALCSVSLSPPTLLVSVSSRSASLAALLRRGWFAVNLLADTAVATAARFAAPVEERFAGLAWAPGPAAGMPCLSGGVCGSAECRVSAVWPVGDHTIVLGAVEVISQQPAVPLLYGQRRYEPFGAAAR
jgi:flavin reductase (DIM6/NTAB) family NADH-FMN oxidoreductase RutF